MRPGDDQERRLRMNSSLTISAGTGTAISLKRLFDFRITARNSVTTTTQSGVGVRCSAA